PAVVALGAYCNDAHWNIQAFAITDDEWADMKKANPEHAKKRAKQPTPSIPYNEDVMIAPEMPFKKSSANSFANSRQRILDAIARTNRALAVDPDRVT